MTEASAQTLLELVDPSGQAIGIMEKIAAHTQPGHEHRAFSVFLFDDDGRMLLQRRALTKYHSPGVWSNTCCGHPFPGEDPAVAATRRVGEELGIVPVDIAAAGTVRYSLTDPRSGLIEREFNHVFVGRFNDRPQPDPAEVGEWAVVTAPQLAVMRDRTEFSVWFPAVFNRVSAAAATAQPPMDAWR